MKPSIAIVEIEDKWEMDHLRESFEGIAEVNFYKETAEILIDKIKDAEILATFISSKVSKKVIDGMPGLKFIATRSTGYDHIDKDYARSKDIPVSNVPTYGDNTVAEHAFALIMALARNLKKCYAKSSEGDFTIKDLMGFDLKGKTIGVVGAGHIGLRVIKIAVGFGMNVLAYARKPNQFLAEVVGYKYIDLNTLLKSSDIISLHVPHNESTHHMINSDTIKLIKKGALLINTGRGGLVDTVALAKALDEGILSGAGLDVLEGEDAIIADRQLLMQKKKDLHDPERLKLMVRNGFLLQRKNVIFTPHIGFYSKEALQRILDTTADNIKSFLAQAPTNVVNYPLSVYNGI